MRIVNFLAEKEVRVKRYQRKILKKTRRYQKKRLNFLERFRLYAGMPVVA